MASEFFSGVGKGFRGFSNIIVNGVNFILLVPVYFVGIGLTSIIAKIFGKHFLDNKFKSQDSYWIERKISKEPIENYYRQF